ncbi:MAG: glycosyltransferase [Bacteroidales bacterium]
MVKRYLFYTAGDYDKTPETGGSKRFYELLKYLIEQGNEVFLIAPEDIKLPRWENLHLIPVKTYHSKIFPNGFLNLIFNWRTIRKASRIPVDKTVLFSVVYGIQGVLAGMPNIVLLLREDLIDYQLYRRVKNKYFFILKVFFYRLIEYITFRNIEKIIVQSHYDKAVLLKRHSVIHEKISDKTEVLINNVNASWMLFSENLVRKIPVQPKGDYHFIFTGNFHSERKGASIVLAAVNSLLQDGFPICLFLLGGGKLRKTYEEEYKNRDRIIFLGYQTDPLKVISRVDLLIVPSLADSCPNTVLEGLYLKIPVIGTNRGGIPELLKEPELLFEPDVSSLKEKLKDIIENNKFELLRQKCIKRSDELNFDWSSKLVQMIDA